MVINNIVKLIGYMGLEVKIFEFGGEKFVVFLFVIIDFYKDKEIEEWKDKKFIWYNFVVFNLKFVV